MEVQDKYLPSKEEREKFLETRIEEYKKQIFGGTVEVAMVTNNQPAVDQLEYNIKTRIADVDVLTELLDNLE